MHDWAIKKIIFFLLAGSILIQPCFAESTSHEASLKNQTVMHHKKHVRHKSHKSHLRSKKFKKSRHKLRHKHRIHKIKAIPNDRTALTTTKAVVPETAAPVSSFFRTTSLFRSISSRAVDFVRNTVTNLRYSAYKLGGTRFDPSHGIYIVDCSDYIDHILQTVYPDAYLDLVHNTGSEKPTTAHYYDFFNALNNDPNDYWSRVNNVEKLQPGDILVFRYKTSYGRMRGGHVMVVMDKPIRDENDYLVRVADSAPVGHSQDTRLGGVSGIGIGTILLKANARTGQPFAFAWRIGSRFEWNVNIAMARPANIY